MCVCISRIRRWFHGWNKGFFPQINRRKKSVNKIISSELGIKENFFYILTLYINKSYKPDSMRERERCYTLVQNLRDHLDHPQEQKVKA